MDDLFTDPGDLGFFNREDDIIEPDQLENEFYEPAPGEEETW